MVVNPYHQVTNENAPHLGGNVWIGDPWTFAPKVWKYLIDRFAASSVLDVGSGRGHAAKWFYDNGCKVVAMDGEAINVYNSFYPTIMHDLTKAAFYCPVDLVHCQEVVEHIEESYQHFLMSTLANGSIVFMTHAEPNQPGHHHVNCKPQSYWVSALDYYGFNFLGEDTMRIRKIAASEEAHHIVRSGLVFGKRK